jgi:hypothetical protein
MEPAPSTTDGPAAPQLQRSSPPFAAACCCGACYSCLEAEAIQERQFARHLEPNYYHGAVLRSASPLSGFSD